MCPLDSPTSRKLDKQNNSFETRQATRHRLKRGFIAFGSENFGEIINISRTGIAIEFMAHKNTEAMDISEINLVNNLEGYVLSQLGCTTVYTSDTPTSSSDNVTVLRRVGMKFTTIDESQQSQLNTLLDNYSAGEYSTMN